MLLSWSVQFLKFFFSILSWHEVPEFQHSSWIMNDNKTLQKFIYMTSNQGQQLVAWMYLLWQLKFSCSGCECQGHQKKCLWFCSNFAVSILYSQGNLYLKANWQPVHLLEQRCSIYHIKVTHNYPCSYILHQWKLLDALQGQPYVKYAIITRVTRVCVIVNTASQSRKGHNWCATQNCAKTTPCYSECQGFFLYGFLILSMY